MQKPSIVWSLLVAFSLSLGCGYGPISRSGEKSLMTLDLGGGTTMDLVLVPPGSFVMGDFSGEDDEKPVHKVTITKPFYIGKYEVTQEQWQAVMGNNPSEFKGAKLPVDSVSWLDCQNFVSKLNTKIANSGTEFALPTEAQWEYACRAGGTTEYYFGDEESSLVEHGWYDQNAVETTHLVGKKQPNAWGLFDMHGNVWEWCFDAYNATTYKDRSAAEVDPVQTSGNGARVLRGGSWHSNSWHARVANREKINPERGDDSTGFRIVRVGK